MRLVPGLLAASLGLAASPALAQQPAAAPAQHYVSCADHAADARQVKLAAGKANVMPQATVASSAALIDDCTVLAFYVLPDWTQPGRSPVFVIRRWSTSGRRDPAAAPKIDYATCPAVKDTLVKLEALPLPAPRFLALHQSDPISVGTDGSSYDFWAGSGHYDLKIPGADMVRDVSYSAWSHSPLEGFVVEANKSLATCWSDAPPGG